jgi:Flp pilus assembly protein TadG
VVPLLLCMYLVTMEVSQAIETNKKVSRIGSMIADLVTQQQTTTQAELNAIMEIGQALLTPYYRTKPSIFITAIEITDEPTPKVKVFWGRKRVDDVPSAYLTKGDIITTVPAKLQTPGSFLIRVEADLDYKPVIAWAAADKPALGLTATFGNIAMKETYYLRPRMSTQVLCADC